MRPHGELKIAIPSDDEALVRRVLAGDAAAFRTIMQRHNRRLYRIARSILRNDSEAEDAVQEAYIKAFTHLNGFRAEASLSTWLVTFMSRPSMSILRDAAGRHPHAAVTSTRRSRWCVTSASGPASHGGCHPRGR